MPSEDWLTDSQWSWIQCQMLLDDGLQGCPVCPGLSAAAYCPDCGARLRPEGRGCPECHLEGVGAFCQHCGTAMGSMVGDAIDAGTYDWTAWADSLRPFLGPLTGQEQALLIRGQHAAADLQYPMRG